MKRIPLSGKNGDGKFAIVDDEDFDIVSRISWYMNKYGYAVHTNHTPVKGEKRFWMHREKVVLNGVEYKPVNK